MEQEIWKDCFGELSKRYQVSSLGRIKRKPFISTLGRFNSDRNIKEKFISLCVNKRGYVRVKLFNKKQVFAHRLIAEAFISNPKNKPFINHINGIKSDNRVENLEWCTSSENLLHSYKLGLSKKRFGKDHHLFGKIPHNKKVKNES